MEGTLGIKGVATGYPKNTWGENTIKIISRPPSPQNSDHLKSRLQGAYTIQNIQKTKWSFLSVCKSLSSMRCLMQPGLQEQEKRKSTSPTLPSSLLQKSPVSPLLDLVTLSAWTQMLTAALWILVFRPRGKWLACEWLIIHLPNCKYGQDPSVGSPHSKSLLFLQELSEMSLWICVHMQERLPLLNNVKIAEPP